VSYTFAFYKKLLGYSLTRICSISYWCFDAIGLSLGQASMHFAQSRINTGDCASRCFGCGDVVQLVRTLLSKRHNDVSDLEISADKSPQTSPEAPFTTFIQLDGRSLVPSQFRVTQPRTYLLNQSIVRCQARSAAALLYRSGVASQLKPCTAPA
jgi:hypothetical protein